MKIACLLVAIVFPIAHAQNDLNTALDYVIGEMGESGFFADSWRTYFETGPIPVPDCDPVALVPASQADAALRRVLDAQVIKVGINTLAAGAPNIYSLVGDPNELTSDPEELDGYEVACIKEAVRLFNVAYQTNVTLEIVPIDETPYFEPLRDALNDETVDIVWSGMVVNDERAAAVDFTCPSFQTDFVLAAGDGVGSELPPADGPDIPVACIAIFCSLDLPAPFVLSEIVGGTFADLNGVLTNTTGGMDYNLGSFEQLAIFFQANCNNCSFVETSALSSVFRAPSTKKMANTTETFTPTVAPTSSGVAYDSVLTLAILAVMALWVG